MALGDAAINGTILGEDTRGRASHWHSTQANLANLSFSSIHL